MPQNPPQIIAQAIHVAPNAKRDRSIILQRYEQSNLLRLIFKHSLLLWLIWIELLSERWRVNANNYVKTLWFSL
jgi:hypothetical protein